MRNPKKFDKKKYAAEQPSLSQNKEGVEKPLSGYFAGPDSLGSWNAPWYRTTVLTLRLLVALRGIYIDPKVVVCFMGDAEEPRASPPRCKQQSRGSLQGHLDLQKCPKEQPLSQKEGFAGHDCGYFEGPVMRCALQGLTLQ